MTDTTGFEYVRSVDFAALEELPSDKRFSQVLLDRASGAEHCTAAYIRTPAGGGSPEGMHVHDFEQVFYVLDGTMTVQIGDDRQEVSSGSLIVFPAGQPHRNWNATDTPTIHLAFAAPAPKVGDKGTYPA